MATATVSLASRNVRHPKGLANSSGLASRDNMFHTLTAMVSFTHLLIAISLANAMPVSDHIKDVLRT